MGGKGRPASGRGGIHQSMLPSGDKKGHGHRSFASPKNDGNLYTSNEPLRETDIFGNRKGAARPSGVGCALTTLGAAGPFLLVALMRKGRGW